jgi:imidazolonepropionase
MERADSVIVNANELLTLSGLNRARIGNEMNELGIIENGALAIKNGRIIGVGKTMR